MTKKIKKSFLIVVLLIVIISTVSIFGGRYFLYRGKNIESKNPEKENINFKIATTLNPFLGEGYAHMAKNYHRDFDLSKIDQSDINGEVFLKSIQFYKKAIDLGRSDEFIYKNLGALSYRLILKEDQEVNEKNAKEAITYLKEANNISPEAINFYRIATLEHLILNDFDKALLNFDKAIEIDNQFEEAYTGKGYLYNDLEEYENALLNFDKAIEIEPSAKAYVGKTKPLINVTDNLKTAIKTNLDALKIENDNPIALYNLVDIYTSLNEKETAQFYLSRLKNSNNQVINRNIKRLEENINNLENE